MFVVNKASCVEVYGLDKRTDGYIRAMRPTHQEGSAISDNNLSSILCLIVILSGYQRHVEPSITAMFESVALRVGHSLVPPGFYIRYNSRLPVLVVVVVVFL